MNSSQDIVDVLKMALEDEGFRAVTFVSTFQEGPDAAVHVLRQHQPQAVIYSVSVPYEASWAVFQQVRHIASEYPYILTTTNKRVLRDLVGAEDSTERIGKPFDLEDIIQAVRRAIQRGGRHEAGPLGSVAPD